MNANSLVTISVWCRILNSVGAASEFYRENARPYPSNPPVSPIPIARPGTQQTFYYIYAAQGFLGQSFAQDSYQLEWVDGLAECVAESAEPANALPEASFLEICESIERSASELGLTVKGT